MRDYNLPCNRTNNAVPITYWQQDLSCSLIIDSTRRIFPTDNSDQRRVEEGAEPIGHVLECVVGGKRVSLLSEGCECGVRAFAESGSGENGRWCKPAVLGRWKELKLAKFKEK